MSTLPPPLFEINHKAIQVLYKEIGIANTIRFIQQYTQGFGNYTKERDKLFENESLDSIMKEIKKQRKA